MTSPRRVGVPRGIPDSVWLILLADIYCVVFTVAGFDCVSVSYSREASTIVIRDPHQHIHRDRKKLYDAIVEAVHSDIAPYVHAALIGIIGIQH